MLVRTEPAYVFDSPLTLSATRGRREFKTNSGHNNHFLITVLVGLDAVADGTAVLKPEFSTSWSPRDARSSAARSREYALKTSLSWTSDMVDRYRNTLFDLPDLFDSLSKDRISKLSGSAVRLREVAKELGVVDTVELDVVRLGIHWRNRMVHSAASSSLDRQVAARLVARAESIRERHRGMDIRSAIKEADNGKPPRFKEVASIIEAGHQLVQSLDKAAIERLDFSAYADSLIAENLQRSAASGSSNGAPMLWPGNPAKSEARIRQILTQGGFSSAQKGDRALPASYLESLCSLSARHGRMRFLPRENA
ncbi:hypothetical protein ACFQ9V_09935 [Leifsonia sp. NPDC056665]|uniref:hypothetical protein n=1 Tax=Leifsonia sp. NPDC056665 TaxID=3345901 RepID=UPI003680982A